jgi:hypothetical protein
VIAYRVDAQHTTLESHAASRSEVLYLLTRVSGRQHVTITRYDRSRDGYREVVYQGPARHADRVQW